MLNNGEIRPNTQQFFDMNVVKKLPTKDLFVYSETSPYDQFLSTQTLKSLSHFISLKTHATTSLLRPGFYGPMLVSL